MTNRRRVCYVTGTRADFGLMQSTLTAIRDHAALQLDIVVTGMHLSAAHGATVNEIVAANLLVSARVEVDLADSTGATMARNIGVMLQGFVDAFARIKPDVVLLLGDRGEMLAGALAAIHLNIPIAHIHGGERSGTVDEPVRHAISKLSHIHFVATEEARNRLIRMGEQASQVFVTGAPGLDGLLELASLSKTTLCENAQLDPTQRLSLFIFHPVIQQSEQAGEHAKMLIDALLAEGLQVVALMPNADAGSTEVRKQLEVFASHPKIRVVTHLPRRHFVSWMAACDVMLGNSSSGIIEAASFGVPVINVGTRQNLRQRNPNVIDADLDEDAVKGAIRTGLQKNRFKPINCYGDGQASMRIANHLASLPLTAELLLKCNTY